MLLVYHQEVGSNPDRPLDPGRVFPLSFLGYGQGDGSGLEVGRWLFPPGLDTGQGRGG